MLALACGLEFAELLLVVVAAAALVVGVVAVTGRKLGLPLPLTGCDEDKQVAVGEDVLFIGALLIMFLLPIDLLKAN